MQPWHAGLKMQSYTIQVPLDHGNPETGSIEVFFRVVEAIAGFGSSDYLLYLQGTWNHTCTLAA